MTISHKRRKPPPPDLTHMNYLIPILQNIEYGNIKNYYMTGKKTRSVSVGSMLTVSSFKRENTISLSSNVDL